MKCILSAFCLILLYAVEIQGHGMLLAPPGRSSRWRYAATEPAIVNYDDNGLNCGGFGVQWNSHGGKCGFCGDDYGLPTPRPNELGGLYGGTGVITKTYKHTYTARVGFDITANHLGYVYFNLCNLDQFGVESEECFLQHRLKFADGSDEHHVGTTTGWIDADIVLPSGLSCEHCVLRWTYNAGNNWGVCENGTGAMGCGAQENFKSCADISIAAPTARILPELPPDIDSQTNDNEVEAAAPVAEAVAVVAEVLDEKLSDQQLEEAAPELPPIEIDDVTA